jgi:hypothetical protein
MNAQQINDKMYSDGSYLAKTRGTWHLEDSPFKAKQVAKMLARHPDVQPKTICEIGCGSGGILSELQNMLPNYITFTGYEISPQAHAISTRFVNLRCQFVLGDAFADSLTYDLALVMDVIEHVEDCFSFLRAAKRKGIFKLYHIPLETHATATLRGINGWDSVGHIHLFTIETALKSLEYTGHRVIDWILTDGALSNVNTPTRTRVANLLRLPLAKVSMKLTVRLIGGYSMLILTE